MTNADRKGLLWVLLCIGVSILGGVSIARSVNAWLDFRAVYTGTRCLIHHHNPYNLGDIEHEYRSEDGQRPPDSPYYLPAIVLYVNVPATFVIVAPFAALSWGPAHVLWMLLTGSAFTLALILMWRVGAKYAPRVATLLACVIAINCENIFAAGNTAGFVVGLCGIAVWCFLEERLVWIGIVCLGLSLAVKPHDTGIIWLYFVLVGGALRKRALQSFLITAVIGITAAVWISHVAPTWMHDWNANLTAISARGGINEPGPNSFSSHSTYPVIDLQALISIFRDDPRIYNIASYLFCGALLLVWSIWTLRTRFSVARAWIALATAVPFTLLITYHRPWDAKFVMLTIPACCMLWTRREGRGKVAFPITFAAAMLAGDFTLAALKTLADALHTSTAGYGEQLLTMALRRPETIALLAMGAFYLWIYVRTSDVHADVVEAGIGCNSPCSRVAKMAAVERKNV